MKIAQFKAKIRRLQKIIWVMDWIESIPRLGLGKFDFITCAGVLHHLKNPQKGLQILSELDGAIHLMVYGRYARTGVYHIQKVLRAITQEEVDIMNEIKYAKSVLGILPVSHWFNHFQFQVDKMMGDAGIYDLLLHKRDISFTAHGLHRWLQHGSYNFVDYALPGISVSLSIDSRIQDKGLYDNLVKKDIYSQHAACDLVSGHTILFWVYGSKKIDSKANLRLDKNVVYSHGSPIGFHRLINDANNYQQQRNKTFVVAKLAMAQIDQASIEYRSYAPSKPVVLAEVKWPSTEFNNFVIRTLTKKPMTPKTIRSLLLTYNSDFESNLSLDVAIEMLADLFSYLERIGIFYLRHKLIKPFSLSHGVSQFGVLGHEVKDYISFIT